MFGLFKYKAPLATKTVPRELAVAILMHEIKFSDFITDKYALGYLYGYIDSSLQVEQVKPSNLEKAFLDVYNSVSLNLFKENMGLMLFGISSKHFFEKDSQFLEDVMLGGSELLKFNIGKSPLGPQGLNIHFLTKQA